jgi:hypothetical protein
MAIIGYDTRGMEMEKRPEINEYAPYYSTYVGQVPEGDLLHILEQQLKETSILLKGISDSQGHFKYGPNKWSIKEVIGHMADTEKIMCYRLLCIARGERASLPGFNENEYVVNADFNKQSVPALLESLDIARKSTLQLLKSLEPEAWLRRGTANGYDITVRALGYIMAGHELHHRQILNERYLKSENYPSK